MVLLSMVAGSAAATGTVNMFSYNRDGWMTDIQVNQGRRYQKQQVRLSQAEMFREDIRDLVGASVTKQNNYVLIATLVLGMIAECYIEGPMPDGAAEFVSSVYMLCVASSLLYLVLSVLCAVSATSLASECQKDLLVNLVRLPVNEFVAEIDAAEKHESVQAFEHQQLRHMFRFPLADRLALGRGSKSAEEGPRSSQCDHCQTAWQSPELHGGCCPKCNRAADRVEVGIGLQVIPPSSAPHASHSSQPHESGPSPGPAVRRDSKQSTGSDDSKLDPEAQNQQAKKAAKHLEVFSDKERAWDVLGKFAFSFGGLGMSHLLQAYGYFSAAKYYTGSNWASCIAQFLMVLVDAIFARVYMTESSCAGIVGALLNVLGPLACNIAMRCQTPWVDAVCIPICFACHLLWNLMCTWMLYKIARDAADKDAQVSPCRKARDFSDAAADWRSPTGTRSPRSPRELGTMLRSPRTAAELVEQRTCAGQSGCRVHGLPHKYFRVLLGNSVVILAWACTICWAITQAVYGRGDDGVLLIAVPRKLSAGHMPEVYLQAMLRSGQLPPELAEAAQPVLEEQDSMEVGIAPAAAVSVAWPNLRFRPHTIACGRGGTCFVANEFKIFKLDFASAAGTTLSPVTCRVAGAIVDLSVVCTSNGCHPVALVRKASSTSMVAHACSTESSEETLLQGGEDAQRLTVGERTEDLFTMHGRRVVQRVLSEPPEKAWLPLWTVAEARSEKAVALDVARGSGGLLVFYSSGIVELVDPDSGRTCASRAVPPELSEVVSGAAVDGTSALVLVHADRGAGGGLPQVQLWRVGVAALTGSSCELSGRVADIAQSVGQLSAALRGSV